MKYPRKLCPSDSEDTVHFCAVGGQMLSFRNRPGEYGVNRYQSLVLASAACVEAIRCAFEDGVPLHAMRALDVCCGAGPAALALKMMGIGYVEASDVSDAAIERCQWHASLNKIAVDRIVRRDLLGDAVAESGKFHLIASTPPCARSGFVDSSLPEQLQVAIDGGESGAEITVRLVRGIPQHLRAGGRLVLTLPSTIDVASVVQALRESFGQAWRMAPCCPTASRYFPSDHPFAKQLLAERKRGSVFVWEGADGWLWRLTWILVAIHGGSACTGTGLCYAPYGMSDLDDDYWRAIDERGLSPSDLFEAAAT